MDFPTHPVPIQTGKDRNFRVGPFKLRAAAFFFIPSAVRLSKEATEKQLQVFF